MAVLLHEVFDSVSLYLICARNGIAVNGGISRHADSRRPSGSAMSLNWRDWAWTHPEPAPSIHPTGSTLDGSSTSARRSYRER
ncbi:hypothetical protein, partial [Dactylosporangium aurantiacum]|uniref:hypothetical protein n=1 Tax=Dactylosporangium aurantiacum TaxID=35754 RepID=UPI002435EC92